MVLPSCDLCRTALSDLVRVEGAHPPTDTSASEQRAFWISPVSIKPRKCICRVKTLLILIQYYCINSIFLFTSICM